MLEGRGAQVSSLSCGVADAPLPSTCFYTCRSYNASRSRRNARRRGVSGA